MTIVLLVLSLLAFALFALSTDDHHRRRLGGRPSTAVRRRLRIGAWAAVAAGFPAAILARGWIFGPVLWTAALMFAAGAVFLALHLLPLPATRKDPTP